MRIAFVINQFPPHITSGLGRYAELIGPYLARQHRLDVYSLNDGHQPVTTGDGAVTVYRPMGRLLGALSRRRRLNRTRRSEFLLLTVGVLANNLRYVRRLRRAEHRPDVVAIHDSTNLLCGLLSHYLLRLPVVFHVHTTEYGVAPQRSITDPLRLYARLERSLARVSRRIIVATPEVRAQLAAAGWPAERIEVVPLGGTFEAILASPDFDRDEIRAGARRRRRSLGIDDRHPVLLFVGRLERQKGIYPLLEAMPQVRDAVPDVHLVVVGEGDVAGVTRIAARSGIALSLSDGFVGGRELLEYYELADACIFPSHYEPFGLVATEAMAMGKPTILGDGFSQVFLGDPQRPAAVFVRSTDPADIARGIVDVLGGDGQREALADRGARFVRDRLSWARTAASTLDHYAASL